MKMLLILKSREEHGVILIEQPKVQRPVMTL
jgi:hypothetical protein